MAGILFIVNVPKKEYENQLKQNNTPNLNFEREKYEKVSKVIHELKEKQLGSRTICSEYSPQDDDSLGLKCRSTDCLHKHSDCNMHKYNCTTTIKDAVMDDHKCYMKSWDEIKQVMRPKKNKLKITRPMNGIDILGAFRCDTALEIILSDIVSRLDIKNATWTSTKGDKFWQVIFSLESGKVSEELLEVLRTFGIGSRYQSSVSLLPCALYYKSNDRISEIDELESTDRESVSSSAWSRFSSSVRARTNLAQVLHDVRANAALTFDWLFMLLVAAFVAAIGLVENSTVILVASMLISPLMGPITAGTLGTVLQDRSLQLMGLKNEFLGLFMSLVMGFLVGMTICALDERYGVIQEWPTDEMLSRCAHRSLWIGILVAIPSGAGCALAVLGDYTASLVGVAISASLLPPAVNAGLLWAMALTRLIVKNSEQHWLVVLPSELALLGTASLCLTFVNIVCIYLAGITVYKVKEVSPFARRNISWWSTNTARINISRQLTRDKSLDWDAYTKWGTNSMEKRANKNETVQVDANKCASPIQSDTITYRNRPSLIHNLTAQNIEAYCHNFNLQLQDNYIPLKSQDKVNLERHIDVMSDDVQSHNEDNETKSHIAHHGNNTGYNTQHNSYYNLGYEHDKQTEIPNRPTIEPSISFTVDNKRNGIISQTVYDI